MPTDQANEVLQQKLRETEERRKAYYNYVYTDEQRQEATQLIMDAIAVLRGEQAFSTILRHYKIWGQTKNVRSWRENLGGHRENLDVLNDWTPVYFTLADVGAEPYYFYLSFFPPIHGLTRSELEKLLKLKVVYGWKKEGGNMIRPTFDIHTGVQSKMAIFEYSPIEEPKGDYTIEVTLEYLDAKDSSLDGLYAATNELSSVEISRTYLSPEEKSKRSRERVGYLPRTGDPVPETGRYVPVFDDEKLSARSSMYFVTSWEFRAGENFGPAWVTGADGLPTPVPAFWRKSAS